MNSVISKLRTPEYLVCILGVLFCGIWCGNGVDITHFVTHAIAVVVFSLLSILFTMRVKIKYFKILGIILPLYSVILAIMAFFIENNEAVKGWLSFENVSLNVPACLAITYAFVVSLFASMINSYSSKEIDTYYYYKLFVGGILLILISLFNFSLCLFMIFGALAGLFASGLIKHKWSVLVALLMGMCVLVFVTGASIVAIDKALNNNHTEFTHDDKVVTEQKILYRIGVWSDRITDMCGLSDNSQEIHTVKVVKPESMHPKTTVFFHLRKHLGTWAYCLPLLILGALVRITSKNLKYSDMVYRKILGNTMSCCLFMIAVSDMIYPNSNTMSGVSFGFTSLMVGVICACLRANRLDNEKLYS